MDRLLKAFNGTWNTEETWEATPENPRRVTAHGMEMDRPGPGALSLISDYRSSPAAGILPFVSHTIVSYNSETKKFEAASAGSGTAGLLFASGDFKGDDFVLTGPSTMQGKPITLRMTYSNITPAGFTYTIESMSGGKATKLGEIAYSKMNPRALFNRPALGASPQVPNIAPGSANPAKPKGADLAPK